MTMKAVWLSLPIALALTLAACLPVTGQLPSPTAFILPSHTPLPPLPVASPAPPSGDYPGDDDGFDLSTSFEHSESDLSRLMADNPTHTLVQAFLLLEARRSGIPDDAIEWVFGLSDQPASPTWVVIPRDKRSGLLLWPRITEGAQAGLLVPSGNLLPYVPQPSPSEDPFLILKEDFFDLEPLHSPYALGPTEQSLALEATGWFVATLRTARTHTPLLWFSAELEEWLPLRGFYPEGATSVGYNSPFWYASSDGVPNWRFDPDRQAWAPLTLRSPQEAITAIAAYSERGSLTSQSGSVAVHYSDSLLDKVGIESLWIEPSAMDQSWDTLIRLAYQLASAQRGTPLLIRTYTLVGGDGPGLRVPLNSIEVHVTTPFEASTLAYSLARLASSDPGSLVFASVGGAGRTSLIFLAPDGNLTVIQDGTWLYEFEEPTSHFTIATAILGSGFNYPGINIAFAANALGFAAGRRGHGDDGFWAFGCTREENVSCSVFVPPTLRIRWQ
jgi:hypothetical protein